MNAVDTVENVCKEIEKILTKIESAGADKIDETMRAQLEKLAGAAETVGMKAGKKFIDNLTTALKEGKPKESLAVRITALDFYNKNVLSGQGAVEDI